LVIPTGGKRTGWRGEKKRVREYGGRDLGGRKRKKKSKIKFGAMYFLLLYHVEVFV
jgi:hypothetical protein